MMRVRGMMGWVKGWERYCGEMVLMKTCGSEGEDCVLVVESLAGSRVLLAEW